MSRSGARLALVRTIRYVVTHPPALIAGLVGLVAVVAFALLVPSLLVGSGAPLGTTGSGVARLSSGEPVATNDFLRGNQNYNAELVWQSFSDEARRQLQASGGSLASLQQQLQAARERGFKLEDVSYIGGRDLPNGSSVQFYLVGVRQEARADLDYVPYMFTLDRGGKIAKVQ